MMKLCKDTTSFEFRLFNINQLSPCDQCKYPARCVKGQTHTDLAKCREKKQFLCILEGGMNYRKGVKGLFFFFLQRIIRDVTVSATVCELIN